MLTFAKEYNTFLLIDAGRGTVDMTAYSIERSQPLRLKQQLVSSDGEL
jgi:hypothetical protein